MDRDAPLRLRVFGEVAATRSGAPVDLGGRRQRAILAVLLIMRGQIVPLDRIADCVWPSDAPANVAGAVQSYVSHLRRSLQPEASARHRVDVIASTGAGYVLRLDTENVDAWRLEAAVDAAATMSPGPAAAALDEALHLWQGPPYAEYAGEPWVEAETARLTELYAVARERLVAARLQIADAAVLVGDLEALVADDPLREERWRLLVLALYRAQRQADALSALRRARATLADELGVDPGPALRSLEVEVLAQSPALDPPAPPQVAASPQIPAQPQVAASPQVPAPPQVPAQAPGPPDAPASGDLVERADEIEVLRRLIDQTTRGQPGCVLIEGPAGIGKTRLLAEASRLAVAAGLRVLSARGSPMEQAFGFGVVRQLFERCTSDPARRDALLAGAAAGAVAVLADVAPEGATGPPPGGFAALHALYWLTVNLASEDRLVICIDEAQWCDTDSLRYVAYLIRRLEELPVLLLLTRRAGEGLPDDPLMAEIAFDSAVTVLRPTPLSVQATARLVTERLGEAAGSFVSVCHRMTAGNPLLLRQLLRALEDQQITPDVSHVDTVRAVGSRAVSAQVALRLHRMPAAAVAVAQGVAVLGQAAELPTLAALVRLPEEQVAAALAELGRSEILTDGPRPAFIHPLVQEAVYADLPAGQRALQHEHAARLLRRQAAPAEHVATHLMPAPGRGSSDTVELLRSAARAATARGASDSALRYLRRALAEPPRAEDRAGLLRDLGMIEILVDGPAAVADLSEAYVLLGDDGDRARVALALTRAHVFVSPPGVATRFAAAAAARVPADCDDERQGLLALERITGFMQELPDAPAGPDPVVSGDGEGARMLAAAFAYEHLRDGVDRDLAVRLSRFALADDRLLEVDNGLLWVAAAAVLLLADEGLGDFWDRAMTYAQANGGLFTAMSVNLWRGFTQWRYGRLDDALQSLADAREQLRMWGMSDAIATYPAAFTLGALLDRGDLEAAAASLDAAGELPHAGEGARLLREQTARLRIQQGRPDAALALLTPPAATPEVANPAWSAARSLKAQALARLGRREEALVLADDDVAVGRRWGAPSSLGPSLRLRGEIAGPAGVADLREAVDLLAGSRADLERACAQLALGCSPQLADAEALPLLESALDTARACRAEGVVREAVSALRERGRSPEPDQVPGSSQAQVTGVRLGGAGGEGPHGL